MATGGGEDERNALTILWRIENMSHFRRDFHWNAIESHFFGPHTLENKSSKLILFPRGESVNDENVCLLLYTDSLFSMDFEFSFLTRDGSPLVTRKGIRDTELGWGFRYKMADCLTQEELFVTKKSTFLHHDTLTVRCRLWKSEGNFPHDEFISARNRIEFAERSISWPIEGCSGLKLSQSETLTSSLIFVHEVVRLYLECSLTSDSLQKLELNIEVTADELLRDYVVKLEVSVLENEQEVMKLEGQENSFSKSDIKQSWVVTKFVLGEILRKKNSLLQYSEDISLLFHLTAVCKYIPRCIENSYIGTINLKQDRARTTSTKNHLQRRNDCLNILGEDFLSLYQKHTFSDFELRAGDVCFPVHKVVLSARSPVFNSMFYNDMEESNSESLDVPDLDAHTLNRMLTFLYGGTVEPDLPLESAAKLYYAADKYQVDSLKNMCSSILQSQICVSNVSDILTLADRHQYSDLTSFVHTFILSHFEDVMHSNEWEEFLDVNPALAGKSMHQLCKKKAPKEYPMRTLSIRGRGYYYYSRSTYGRSYGRRSGIRAAGKTQ